eukprot:UN01213
MRVLRENINTIPEEYSLSPTQTVTHKPSELPIPIPSPNPDNITEKEFGSSSQYTFITVTTMRLG